MYISFVIECVEYYFYFCTTSCDRLASGGPSTLSTEESRDSTTPQSAFEVPNRHLDVDMEVVLADTDENGSGEVLSEGKLVISFAEEDKSPEEHRLEKIDHLNEKNLEGGDLKASGIAQTEKTDLTLSNEDSNLPDNISRLNISENDNLEKEESCVLTSEVSKDLSASNEHVQNPMNILNCDTDIAPVSSTQNEQNSSTLEVPSSQSNVSQDDSLTSQSIDDSTQKRLHVHLDNSDFNTFQYWRPPLPEVDIDFDLINGAPANIHVVAKVRLYIYFLYCLLTLFNFNIYRVHYLYRIY